MAMGHCKSCGLFANAVMCDCGREMDLDEDFPREAKRYEMPEMWRKSDEKSMVAVRALCEKIAASRRGKPQA